MKPIILIRPRVLASQLGIGRSTLWRWVQQGILPRPIRIGGIAGWRPEDIEAVIEQLRQKRESKSAAVG
jgi:prophage regulatory protein